MELKEIENTIKGLLEEQMPPLRTRVDTEKAFEVAGTKEVMQGKQKVDGHYFATIMPKPKDVRFYFFPIYTHVDHYELSPNMQKFLKGKSCFHIKKLDEDLIAELKGMISKGVELYQKDELI